MYVAPTVPGGADWVRDDPARIDRQRNGCCAVFGAHQAGRGRIVSGSGLPSSSQKSYVPAGRSPSNGAVRGKGQSGGRSPNQESILVGRAVPVRGGPASGCRTSADDPLGGRTAPVVGDRCRRRTQELRPWRRRRTAASAATARSAAKRRPTAGHRRRRVADMS